MALRARGPPRLVTPVDAPLVDAPRLLAALAAACGGADGALAARPVRVLLAQAPGDLQSFGGEREEAARITLGTYLRHVQSAGTADDPLAALAATTGLYLSQATILSRARGGAPPLLPELARYLAPAALAGHELASAHLWVSARATVASTHYDEEHNVLCVVAGRKEVAVVGAEHSQTLRAHPLHSDLHHHARVRLFPPPPSPPPPPCEAAAGSAAAGSAAAACGEATASELGLPVAMFSLGAGQALFIPAGCWHSVRSEPRTVGVNFWYAAAAAAVDDDGEEEAQATTGSSGAAADAALARAALRRLLARRLDADRARVLAAAAAAWQHCQQQRPQLDPFAVHTIDDGGLGGGGSGGRGSRSSPLPSSSSSSPSAAAPLDAASAATSPARASRAGSAALGVGLPAPHPPAMLLHATSPVASRPLRPAFFDAAAAAAAAQPPPAVPVAVRRHAAPPLETAPRDDSGCSSSSSSSSAVAALEAALLTAPAHAVGVRALLSALRGAGGDRLRALFAQRVSCATLDALSSRWEEEGAEGEATAGSDRGNSGDDDSQAGPHGWEPTAAGQDNERPPGQRLDTAGTFHELWCALNGSHGAAATAFPGAIHDARERIAAAAMEAVVAELLGTPCALQQAQ